MKSHDGQTLAQLSRRMLVTAGNLTGLVDRAERDGVVVRRTDPRDRRLSRVSFTSAGRAFIQALLPKHAGHVSALLSCLDGSERRELRRALGKLRDAVSEKSRG
jgi:DNA-binding MarR family transcriptional regulator